MIEHSTFADLEPSLLYALLRLRVDVFVVEQECPYPELDGRDTEPRTTHWWVLEAGAPVATLRVLQDEDARVIGRVATARAHRGQGMAADLMRAVLQQDGNQPLRLSAQAHLERWYGGFGFTAIGPEYLDDGIPHVPMARPATPEAT